MTELEKKVQFNQMNINPHNPSSRSHLYFQPVKIDESVIVYSFFNPYKLVKNFYRSNSTPTQSSKPNPIGSIPVQFPTRIYIKVTCCSRFQLSCPSQRAIQQNSEPPNTHTKKIKSLSTRARALSLEKSPIFFSFL